LGKNYQLTLRRKKARDNLNIEEMQQNINNSLKAIFLFFLSLAHISMTGTEIKSFQFFIEKPQWQILCVYGREEIPLE